MKDHFLRQQRGGNIAGFRGVRMQRGYGIGIIFKSLARYAIHLFKQGAKVVGKRALQAAAEVGQDVLQGKNVKESFKSRGKQAVSDVAENAAKKVMIGKGRKKGIKRAVPAKTPIRGPTEKQKHLSITIVQSGMALETMHKDSCMCSKSELDLFSVPPTQVVMGKGFWEDVDPITSISSSDTIEFLCAANSGVYTDLASSYVYVKAKITTTAGGNVGADIQVGPSNLWMHALFSQVEVFLNKQLVTPSSTAYPYRAYIETILNFSKDAKDSHLTSALFYKDKAGKMDVVNPLAQDANTGLKQRHAYTRESKSVAMEGRLHSDLFAQDRYILGAVPIKIKLVRSRNSFLFGIIRRKSQFQSGHRRMLVSCTTS